MLGARQRDLLDRARPARSISPSERSKTSATPGSTPSAWWEKSRATPIRSPSSDSSDGASTPPSIPTEVESRGSRPSIAAQQQRRVGDRPGQRPALIERGGEGDHPEARDRAVGRLQPDDPAQRRGLADRAAGVGADRPWRQAPGDRRGRAAGGAARNPPAVPRVAHRPVGGVLVRRPHRELVHVGLAEQPRAGVGEPANRGRRVRRPVALEDPRARGGLDALGAEEVLDRHRQAAQRLAAGRRARPARRATGRR